MKSTDPVATFRQEARDLLEQLEQALLDLEQNSKNATFVDSAFRALHTIKGSSSMFGFDDVANFVHDFETAFDRVRKGKAKISRELIAVALRAKDHIHKLITEPGPHVAAGDTILAALQQIVEPDQETHAPAVIPEKPEPVAAGSTKWRIRFRLPPNAIAFGTNPLSLLDELRALGTCEVVASDEAVPALDEIDPEQCYLAWEVALEANCERGTIEDVFLFLRDEMELAIEQVDDNAIAEASPAPSAPVARTEDAPVTEAEKRPAAKSESGGTGESTLRVPAERLDELMDRVGELVIAQSRLFQIAHASDDLNLKSVAEELERLAAGLRDTTMSIRMVPIDTLFSRFRRVIRDLSHDLGKEIDFVTAGEETELDKTIIERLADPLLHLIRNAIDHGLEHPSARVKAGKSPQGKLRLSARHTGAEVAISISDDGAGLNAERIRAKAEEAGLIQAGNMLPESELFQLIFHPGFSTAKEVTSLSGRGVGMDVVKRTITSLRGNIDLASRAGEGTTVTLRIPLTLAIIEGMLVRVGRGRYSIPLSAVEECVELPKDAGERQSGRNFLSIRGNLVPFLRLRELFKTQAPPEPHQMVVIVSSGESRVGLVVDQLLGNNQTVIKSLSKLHADVETFSGATILGDGTVALILDVAHLISFGESFENHIRGQQIGRAA